MKIDNNTQRFSGKQISRKKEYNPWSWYIVKRKFCVENALPMNHIKRKLLAHVHSESISQSKDAQLLLLLNYGPVISIGICRRRLERSPLSR